MGVNDIVNIGNIIKTIRILFNYSQKEMAEKLGIAPSTYSGYETNYREPSKEIINKIEETAENKRKNEIYKMIN